jgi:hypothetical protein
LISQLPRIQPHLWVVSMKFKCMKKALFLIAILCLGILQLHSQSSFSLKLYAGSNASWGKSQTLSIDSKGHCFYALSEVKKGIIDSSRFSISAAQFTQLQDVIAKIQFFKLEKTYNAKSRDGTRLSVEVASGGKDEVVHWVNIHNKESDLLLQKLNEMLKSKNIRISY